MGGLPRFLLCWEPFGKSCLGMAEGLFFLIIKIFFVISISGMISSISFVPVVIVLLLLLFIL